jgi:hypothetical protein
MVTATDAGMAVILPLSKTYDRLLRQVGQYQYIPVEKKLLDWVSEPELFARSYAQYIAIRSGHTVLGTELLRRQQSRINQVVPL